jgi:DNA-binding response OmpR family regulator
MAKKKIIVADDEPAILSAIRETLQDDYDVRTASDGREALELIKKETPDMALLDIMMPQMGGIDLCRKIKSDRSLAGMPIIFLTAKGQVSDVEYGFKVGADAYIVKPFSVAVLIRKMENLFFKIEHRKK